MRALPIRDGEILTAMSFALTVPSAWMRLPLLRLQNRKAAALFLCLKRDIQVTCLVWYNDSANAGIRREKI